MRAIIMTAALLLAAGPALAEWRAMTGAEIAQALSGRTLMYDRAWQRFDASGRTAYNAGVESHGRWRIDGDRYCSKWPPSNAWSCYGMSRHSETGALRFEAISGHTTVGHYAR